jgi:serine/threonine protein phosphatase PrpC
VVGGLTLRAACLSDQGLVRCENEDRCIFEEDLGLFGVADGLGGLPAGAEAAQAAAHELVRSFREGADLPEAVQVAGRAVNALGQRLNPLVGIATTLTVGCIRGGTLLLAHAGDSRCYRLRGGRISLLTEDHNVANECRREGGRPSPLVNPAALTRCVGQPGPLRPDISEQALETGDRLLFCTDGIHRTASDPEIGAILGRETSPEACLKSLVALALSRGGPDNASGVVVSILSG